MYLQRYLDFKACSNYNKWNVCLEFPLYSDLLKKCLSKSALRTNCSIATMSWSSKLSKLSLENVSLPNNLNLALTKWDIWSHTPFPHLLYRIFSLRTYHRFYFAQHIHQDNLPQLIRCFKLSN